MNKESSGESPSAAVWREWFDRIGPATSVDLVNATANLVIAERDIYAQPIMRQLDRLADNESKLLRAIEAACHAWNQTPATERTDKLQEAINLLSSVHQEILGAA
ncbi:MAG TPA: hypothetical protein VN256_12875 [Pyrinomonadaceae bacterium]|nr:hypothetical protein [Pyrinomonadaceae bacterium]